MSELLYHYTTIDTLQKIMQEYENEELCIWATHAEFLNDPQEYIYALDLLKESMIQYEIQNDINENDRKSNYLFSDNAAGLISSLMKFAGEPYIISFSNNKDSLPMWRGYAKDGQGISIGFDKKMLREFAEERSKNKNYTVLLECTYDRENTIESMIDLWRNYYKDFSLEAEGKPSVTLNSFILLFRLMNSCFSSKNDSYEEEQEYRLCTYEQNDYHIRAKGSLMIPYIKHDIIKTMIRKIIIGPCVNQHVAKKGLEMFLKKHGYLEIDKMLEVSNISYRQI